jgi:TRAP-type C4-dicarboxylate transport system permease small subunit
VILFLGIIGYTSKFTISAMADTKLMSIPVPINVTYWSVPIGCSFMIYYIFRSIMVNWREFRLSAQKRN